MSKQQAIADIAKAATSGASTLLPSGDVVPTTWEQTARPETVAYVNKYNADVAAELERNGGSKTRSELLKKAYARNSYASTKDLRYDIADARVLTTHTAIYPRTIMTSAFWKPEDLKRNEQGIVGIRSYWSKNITASWLGIEGGNKLSTQLVESLRLIPFQLARFHSDKVEYPTEDLEKGDLELDAWIKAQVEDRFATRFDVQSNLMRDLLLMTSGLSAMFEPAPEVDTSTIPDSNDLNMVTEGAFTFNVMLAIKLYALKWGMRPANLFFNVNNAMDVYRIPALVTLATLSGYPVVPPQLTVPEKMREEFFTDTEIMSFLSNAKMTFLNTLRTTGGVNTGEVYVSFVKDDIKKTGDTGQLGWAAMKPESEKTIVYDGPEYQRIGMEAIELTKAGNFVSAGPLYKNVLRIQFAGSFVA